MQFDPKQAEWLAADLLRKPGQAAPYELLEDAAAMLRAAVKEVRFMHENGFAQSEEIDRLRERVRELERKEAAMHDRWAGEHVRCLRAEKVIEAARVWAAREGDRSGNSGQALLDALDEYDERNVEG